jgi:hypothetical protein
MRDTELKPIHQFPQTHLNIFIESSHDDRASWRIQSPPFSPSLSPSLLNQPLLSHPPCHLILYSSTRISPFLVIPSSSFPRSSLLNSPLFTNLQYLHSVNQLLCLVANCAHPTPSPISPLYPLTPVSLPYFSAYLQSTPHTCALYPLTFHSKPQSPYP